MPPTPTWEATVNLATGEFPNAPIRYGRMVESHPRLSKRWAFARSSFRTSTMSIAQLRNWIRGHLLGQDRGISWTSQFIPVMATMLGRTHSLVSAPFAHCGQ